MLGGHYRNDRRELKRAAAAKTSSAAPPAASAAASHQFRLNRPASASTPAKKITQPTVPAKTPTQTTGSSRAPPAATGPASAGTATNQKASVIGFSSVISNPVTYARPEVAAAPAIPLGSAPRPTGSSRHASRSARRQDTPRYVSSAMPPARN